MLTMKRFVRYGMQICGIAIMLVWSVRGADLFWVRPLEVDASMMQATTAVAAEPAEPYVTRRAPVSFPTNFVALSRSIGVSDAFKMRFFDSTPDRSETVVQAKVGRRGSVPDGVVSVAARLVGSAVETVLITATEERVLITVQDHESGMQYRVTGNLKTGIGEVIEIDPAKMPAVTCETCCALSPAIVPPKESPTE